MLKLRSMLTKWTLKINCKINQRYKNFISRIALENTELKFKINCLLKKRKKKDTAYSWTFIDTFLKFIHDNIFKVKNHQFSQSIHF